MAFSGEAQSLVWQRAEIALRNASPGAQAAMRALKTWLAAHKLALSTLQFVAFDRTTNGTDGSNADTVICSAACTLYYLYGKKFTTATLSYLKISNHASAIQAQGEIILASTTASIELQYISYQGFAFATGATLASVTAYNGTTHNALAASHDGFAVIGA